MAQSKPSLSSLNPLENRILERGEPTGTQSPVATLQLAPAAANEPSRGRRQTAVRLTDEVIDAVHRLAGKQTMESGKRIGSQDVLEKAIVRYLQAEGMLG